MFRLVMILAIFMSLQSQALETFTGAQKDYEIFKKDMSTKIENIGKEIGTLKNKANSKGSMLKEQTLLEIEKNRNDLREKLNRMETTSKDQWRSLKKNLAEGADSLHSQLQKALEDENADED